MRPVLNPSPFLCPSLGTRYAYWCWPLPACFSPMLTTPPLIVYFDARRQQRSQQSATRRRTKRDDREAEEAEVEAVGYYKGRWVNRATCGKGGRPRSAAVLVGGSGGGFGGRAATAGRYVDRHPMFLTSLECQVSELVNSDTRPRPTTGTRCSQRI